MTVVRTFNAKAVPPFASRYTDLAREVRAAGLMRRQYRYYWTQIVAAPGDTDGRPTSHGTGFGLYLVAQLARANGATISYRPPSDRHRSGFVVGIPYAG